MRLVVDASVAIKWLVDEEDSDTAGHLLTQGHILHAPRLMAAEIANALWRKARSGEIARHDATVLADSLTDIQVRWADDEQVCSHAARIAIDLGHPAYDCVYLALAHLIDGLMVTADTRFANAVASTEHRSRVTLLADFTPE